MPDEVKDRVHALERQIIHRRDNTNDGGSDDDDSDDSTYDPNDVDDNNDSDDKSNDSDNSDADDDSDYSLSGDSDDEKSPDSYDVPGATHSDQPLPTPTSVELGGVNNTGNHNSRYLGVATNTNRNVGVATKITETNGNNITDLEAYVNELETELDNEIAELDRDYNQQDSETDGAFEPMEKNKADELRANATREQASDDAEMPALHNQGDDDDDSNGDSNDEPDDDAPEEPLGRLRNKRAPTYKHLKGRDGGGSLRTLARPHEFGGGRHQSHVILQRIIMTQYNLKQGIC
jgi:hypothetical protein